jgi:heterodisulfide reductase subunit A
LARGKVAIEPIIAAIDEGMCSGCRVCRRVCKFNALEYDEEEGLVKVNEVLCKGCGTCAVACPSKAISINHYTDIQLSAQLAGVLA